MIYIYLIYIIAILFAAQKFYVKFLPERLFLNIYTVSTIYYGILGPWYWKTYHSSIFLGIDWSREIERIELIYILVYSLVVFTTVLLCRKNSECVLQDYIESKETLSKKILVLVGLGGAGCLYVYIVGGALIESGAAITEDGLALIFYQLSDLLIGVLLFLFAKRGASKTLVMLAILFCAFSIVSGYRYKILLLLAPILMYVFLNNKEGKAFVRMAMIAIGIAGVAIFSLMTISRVKFSGLDWDLIADADISDLLYGLFAETNSIFGLASTLSIFGETIPFSGITPLIEVVTQFVPRAIYPEKDLYLHLKSVAWWLTNSQEGLDSGTTIVFFGEYYAMQGWVGILFFVPVYVMFALWMMKFLRRYSTSRNLFMIGASMIAIFFGYYYFSRGSIGQVSKGLIFAYAPYFYLLREYCLDSKEIKKHSANLY